jgi:hypothetical protein
LVLPALPALYLALAFEIGETKRLSTLTLGLNTFYFEKPGSITYTIPSIVKEVSAILVETTIFLPGNPFLFEGGGASKILYCKCIGKVEYNGITFNGGASSPNLLTSSLIFLQAVSISSSPVKNNKTSPGSSKQWILKDKFIQYII